jgi:hypothetical protein
MVGAFIFGLDVSGKTEALALGINLVNDYNIKGVFVVELRCVCAMLGTSIASNAW